MALFALFASPTPYQHVPIRDRRNLSDNAFGVWASVALAGLAIVSVALGVVPVVDPVIFAAP
jgi:hypothetical protein